MADSVSDGSTRRYFYSYAKMDPMSNGSRWLDAVFYHPYFNVVN